MGILPDALLNYLVRLGWSHGDQEIFDIDEMIELFEIDAINNSPASFDVEKLLWINQQYIIQADQERLARELAKQLNKRKIGLCYGPDINEVVELMRERAQTMVEMADKVIYLYQDFNVYDHDSVAKYLTPESPALLARIGQDLADLGQWSREGINGVIKNVVKSEGVKFPALAQPLRIAVAGSANTPSIDATVELVGRKRTLERIEKAVKYFSDSNQNSS
jgi:glutamyl-tRNA synthetase